jgi:mono/diheme cytochrome c family protein
MLHAVLVKRAFAGVFIGLAAAALMGCGGEDAPAGIVEVLAQPFTVRPVDWNPTAVNVGEVAAVAEIGGILAVLGNNGASVFSGGVLTATDASVKGWTGASVIPAADGNGTWIAGVDLGGRVLRLRGGMYFEPVSDLYGLEDEAVLHVSALGKSTVAFAMSGELAVTDGVTVTRYDVATYTGLAGANGRAATAGGGEARIFEAASASEITHLVPGAEQAVFDAAGRLVVRTADAIYAEDAQGGMGLRYKAKVGALRELAASDVRVWAIEGTELLSVEVNSVLRTEGAGVSATARLVGSPSGDVWSLDGGALSRFAAETGDSEDRGIWEKDVQPVYLASCTPCHEPGGQAGTDLSTYGAWVARREVIKERVVTAKTMPPTGIEFTEDERAAIEGWIAAGAP